MITIKLANISRSEGYAYNATDSYGFSDYWMNNKSLVETIIEVASAYQETDFLLIQLSRKNVGIQSHPDILSFQEKNVLGICFVNETNFTNTEEKLSRFEGMTTNYVRTRNYFFNRILPGHRSSIKVWTDGSYNYETTKAGWAWVHETGQAAGSFVSNKTTVTFDAEFEAIRQALLSHRDYAVTIYTDSKAVIQKFENNDPIVAEFDGYSFKLEWVKGHAKVFTEFNVIADYLAKSQTL